MIKYKVFIDGSEGTTGLKIYEYFRHRSDIELLTIQDDVRKDTEARLSMINSSDITFLCLPDKAATDIVPYINKSVKVLDTSTAHRVCEGWIYGLPELCRGQREKISKACRVAVPGCHATGFITLVRPLIDAGILAGDYPLSCTSMSGYSGGGKKAIAQYGQCVDDESLIAPRQYALAQTHKHLKEMQAMTGISAPPVFMPFICNYYNGMEVCVPIVTGILEKKISMDDIKSCYREHYINQPFISLQDTDGGEQLDFMPSNELAGKNGLRIRVTGNDERVVLTAVFDNLGKGASGAAVQCMNIMLGINEETGLV